MSNQPANKTLNSTNRPSLYLIAALIGIITSIMMPAPAFADDEALIMGVFPRKDAKQTTLAYKPLIRYLSKKLNRKVVLKVTYNYAKFWKEVKQKRYDIVHYNQYHYVKSHKEYGYDVFVMNEENHESTIKSVMYATKKSGINKIEDIKGKTVSFGGGPKSMVSYILPLYVLKQSDIASYEFKSVFTKNPENAILSVFYKKSDIAAVGTPILLMPKLQNNPKTSNLVPFATSEPIAHLPWAFNSRLPNEVRQNIKQAFLNLKNSSEGQKILKKASVTNFVDAKDSDYNRVRDIIFDVIGTKY